MKIFHLPDLGEGLADAEIREWYVKEGDVVKVDQPLVSMETAKAVVDVPSPYAGKIVKLHGKANEVINTDAPLVTFEGEEAEKKDGGSVVGALEESEQRWDDGDVVIGAPKAANKAVKILPAVRILAKQLNIDIDQVTATGPNGQITAEDVKRQAAKGNAAPASSNSTLTADMEDLHGVRRVMASIMAQSHSEVVPVTIVEDADITDFPATGDMTVCLLKAIASAAKAEPAINAWFDGKSLKRKLFDEVHVGLAVDTPEGLFVPVIKNVQNRDAKDLREAINTYKKSVAARTVAPADLQGATITLSNFGTITGKYASPIIVPPAVAILGCGRSREIAAVHNGQIAIRRILPLSLSFDHRALMGGEAARFLAAVIQFLQSYKGE